MYPFNRLNARSHRLDLQSVNRRVHRKAMVNTVCLVHPISIVDEGVSR